MQPVYAPPGRRKSHAAENCFYARGQFANEPCARRHPVAIDSGAGDAERFGSLLDRQSGEEAELDHAALLRIEFGVRVERIIEGDQLEAAAIGQIHGFVQDVREFRRRPQLKHETVWNLSTYDPDTADSFAGIPSSLLWDNSSCVNILSIQFVA
jgi:hypothetical protein